MKKLLYVIGMIGGLLGLLVAFGENSFSSITSCPLFYTNADELGDDSYTTSEILRLTLATSVIGDVQYALRNVGADIDRDTGLRIFTLQDLLRYNGSIFYTPILLAVGGDVFDVTLKGLKYYGPGRPYSIFAGRAVSRSLALGSLNVEDLEKGDDISDLGAHGEQKLADQHAFYLEKYPRVGRLASKR